jgi:hypothetical protein
MFMILNGLLSSKRKLKKSSRKTAKQTLLMKAYWFKVKTGKNFINLIRQISLRIDIIY